MIQKIIFDNGSGNLIREIKHFKEYIPASQLFSGYFLFTLFLIILRIQRNNCIILVNLVNGV
jgi:hypothetical protein